VPLGARIGTRNGTASSTTTCHTRVMVKTLMSPFFVEWSNKNGYN
jgi:hypothetical protein